MEHKQRTIEGIVVSDKMDKTIVVAVTHTRLHAKYLKSFKVTKKLKVHDEGEVCNVGDRAVIGETRPLSRTKRWTVIQCIPSSVAKVIETPESK